jgi:hypothetical protein
MDIHKPKPWHGVREFLKEYLIIVVGVLTALGGEQAVEWLHHRAEVAEARRALDAEVAFDLGSFQFTLAQRPCLHQRLDEIALWRRSQETARPLRLKTPLLAIPGTIFRTSVWRVASVASVGQMPFEARVDYGRFYDGIAAAEGDRRGAFQSLHDISRLARSRRLTDDQLLQIDDDLDALRALDGSVGRDRFLRGYAQALRVKPRSYAGFMADFGADVRAFCQSVIVPEPAR